MTRVKKPVKMAPRRARGFTLIEVLVALAIVAIALGAVVSAIGALASNVHSARTRLLALWSADNALGQITVAQDWPPPGRSTFACPQGEYRFVCRQSITQLSTPSIKQVEVQVFDSAGSSDVLADTVTVIYNETR
ncbi:type II secretion system minor pseudopilin GspI [Paraburkholderia jirisanensis]